MGILTSLLLLLLIPISGWAACPDPTGRIYDAVDCTQAEISSCATAINANAACTAGSPCTLNIPASSPLDQCTGANGWTSGVTFSRPVTIVGAGVTSPALGAGSTIIDCTSTNANCFTYSGTGEFEMRGLSLTSSVAAGGYSILKITSTDTSGTYYYKIHDNYIYDFKRWVLFTVTEMPGVFYKNTISESVTTGIPSVFYLKALSNGYTAWDTAGWAWNSDNTLFIEGNTFTGVGYDTSNTGQRLWVTDGDLGARFTARYNTLTDAYFTTHGTDSSQRSLIQWEMYNNLFVSNKTNASGGLIATNIGRGMGAYVYHHNKIQGAWAGYSDVHTYANFEDATNRGRLCNGAKWRVCSTGFNNMCLDDSQCYTGTCSRLFCSHDRDKPCSNDSDCGVGNSCNEYFDTGSSITMSGTAVCTGEDCTSGLMTSASHFTFTVAAVTTITGEYTLTSTNNFNTAGVTPGMRISGTGIAAYAGGSTYAARVISVAGDGLSLRMSRPATASGEITATFDVVGLVIHNHSDCLWTGSQAAATGLTATDKCSWCWITSVTEHTVTCGEQNFGHSYTAAASLAGGTANAWSNGNSWEIWHGHPCRDSGRAPAGQAVRKSYAWSNIGCNTQGCTSTDAIAEPITVSGGSWFIAGTHYENCDNLTDCVNNHGLTYTDNSPSCPHTQTGLTGSCNSSLYGTEGYAAISRSSFSGSSLSGGVLR